LDDLVYELTPGPERQRILLLSRVIWGKVFQFSKFKTGTKEEAIHFLEDFTVQGGELIDVIVDGGESVKSLNRPGLPTGSQ
jgi:hypothetical protein